MAVLVLPYCVDAYGEHDNDVYDDDDRSSTITITIIRYITVWAIQTIYILRLKLFPPFLFFTKETGMIGATPRNNRHE